MMLYKSKNATGYKGVTKKGNQYQLMFAGEYVALYGTAKEAAAAYAKVHNEKKAAVAAAIAAAKAKAKALLVPKDTAAARVEKAKAQLEKAEAQVEKAKQIKVKMEADLAAAEMQNLNLDAE